MLLRHRLLRPACLPIPPPGRSGRAKTDAQARRRKKIELPALENSGGDSLEKMGWRGKEDSVRLGTVRPSPHPFLQGVSGKQLLVRRHFSVIFFSMPMTLEQMVDLIRRPKKTGARWGCSVWPKWKAARSNLSPGKKSRLAFVRSWAGETVRLPLRSRGGVPPPPVKP